MNLKEYTFWELIKLSQQIQLEFLVRTWWVYPVILGIGALGYYIKSRNN